jgi:hypothetical protein
MKFLIIHEFKEPIEENLAKALEKEKERGKLREKGKRKPMMKMITPMFMTSELPFKSYWVVDCEYEQIVEWMNDYRAFMNAKISPVITREEWENLQK